MSRRKKAGQEPEGIDEQTAITTEMDADVALLPGSNADPAFDIERYVSGEVRGLYDVYSYRHAASILANSYPAELREIELALLEFRMTEREIAVPGGNESVIPRKFSYFLRPKGWVETRIQGDLQVRLQEYEEKCMVNGKLQKSKLPERAPRLIENFIDGHKIDYVKGRVAFDLEWNSKDQTFDRDLYALRAFHECGLISAGVLVTRSASLNPVFHRVQRLDEDGNPKYYTKGKKAGQPESVWSKYGASTTWMGKLLYRLNAGRHGGCPVLVFGITPKLISDWSDQS